MKQSVIAIIPAYEPTTQLIEVIKSVQKMDMSIVIVDDGSGKDYKDIFQEAKQYGVVLTHEVNRGKGCALRTAMTYIMNHMSENCIVVTLDSDGQHTAKDVMKVVEYAKNHSDGLTLGSRCFQGNVPLRSQMGNRITRAVYWIFSGVKVQDTQTGLRAFSSNQIPYYLQIEGDRYEYEMNVLMQCAKDHVPIYEQEIETIYIDDNSSSHFHAVKDSFRIYKNIFKFAASSFLGFLVDYSIYALLVSLLSFLNPAVYIPIANFGARIVSSIVNFSVNKKIVFRNKDSVIKTGLSYFSLALGIIIINTAFLSILVPMLHWNKYIAKIVIEIVFFFVSWYAQKNFVFRHKKQVKLDTL